jgi:conjugal transfer pilus assembly protein TraL
MSQEKFYIPQHLDDAPKFLFWSIDEAMAGILPVTCGLILGLKLLTIPVAIFSFKGWKKFKGLSGDAGIRSMMYWHYPSNIIGVKVLPDSSIKTFIA